MIYQSIGRGIHIRKGAAKTLQNIDGIIFDCDGVLVDVTKSYDLAIKKTTALVLEELTGSKSLPITSEIIRGFKETGGFNDEVDFTYAVILSLASAKKLKENPKRFVYKVIKNADDTGIKSVEKFLDKLQVDISDVRKKLDYPGPHSTNPLYRTFDQIFYGPKLYKKIFRKKSRFSGKGLIENDRVILTRQLAKFLQQRFGKKPAIVTGRGYQSARYSLKKLLDCFDLRSSVFLEDKPRALAKPNPKALLIAIGSIKSRHCIYVGDSMEDLIMAKRANKLGRKVAFCGIYGTGRGAASRKKFFEKNGAPIILESIRMIPKTLNLVK